MNLFLLVVVLFINAPTAVGQQGRGVISGRVITEDGQPIPHAVVNLYGVSGKTRQITDSREIVTDDEGDFVADGLQTVPYLIAAWVPGYVPAPDTDAINPFGPSDTRFVRVGQSITITMMRGGVITGRVTNDTGAPVVGLPVKALRVKSEHDPDWAHLWTRKTDDRGIYRIYGLAPGAYIVAAGGTDRSSNRSTPFAGRLITYHPSSTRDAATVVNVSSGAEATGIDIRYRGENGFAISGKINGGTAQTSSTILLRSFKTGETIETTYSDDQNSYAFYGLWNGDYELIAKNDGTGSASTARRVAVKDADAIGIDLTLLPYATVSGVVVVMKPDSKALECKDDRESYPEEIIIRAKRDEPAEKRERSSPDFLGYGVSFPYDKGDFTIRDLKPGRHRIVLELPDESWYLKTMTMPGSKPAVDPRAGLILKSGDKINGLRLAIAPGAATLKGKITVAEGAKLPSRFRVHLVPAEAEAIDELLRFAETSTEDDGAFAFRNLAPGKYFVLAIPDSGDESLHPAAWDPAERKKLRKDAEAANVSIELKPCQSITDYALRFKN